MTFNERTLFAIGLLIAASISFIGCEKRDIGDEVLSEVKIIGHGGAGFQSPRNRLPHNSLESMTKAVEFYGIDGVETDIQLSRSGTLWMYHDQTLSTMTNCRGCIPDRRDDRLKNCTYRNDAEVNTFNGPFHLEKLSAFFDRALNYREKPFVFLDIRSNSVCGEIDIDAFRNALALEISEEVSRYSSAEKVRLTSPDRAFIRVMKETDPSIAILYEAVFNTENMQYVIDNALRGMILKNDQTDDEMISKLRNSGLETALYGVKVQSGIVSALDKNPDFVMTDNIASALNVMRE